MAAKTPDSPSCERVCGPHMHMQLGAGDKNAIQRFFIYFKFRLHSHNTAAKAAVCLDPQPVMILICSPAAVCRCARRTGSSVGNQDSLIPGPVSRLSPATSSHPCVVCWDHPVIHTIHIHIHVLAVQLLGFSLLLLMISVRVQLRYVILTVICQLCPQIKLIAARLVIISLFHVVDMFSSTGQS